MPVLAGISKNRGHKVISLRGAGGLGDAVYMYPVLKYYLEHGQSVEILTKYPDVYKPLKKLGLIVTDRYAKQPDRECRYAPRYAIQKTTTFEDTVMLAGIEEKLTLKIEFESPGSFDFKTKNKICVIRNPSLPMNGKGIGELLIPDCTIFQKIIDAFKDRVYFILAGNSGGNFSFPLKGIDLNLTEKLSLPQVMQLITQADINLTQCGFIFPFCEALNRKVFVLFSDRGMKCNHKFFPYIIPKKVINKPSIVSYAIDNEPHEKILERFGELLARGAS